MKVQRQSQRCRADLDSVHRDATLDFPVCTSLLRSHGADRVCRRALALSQDRIHVKGKVSIRHVARKCFFRLSLLHSARGARSGPSSSSSPFRTDVTCCIGLFISFSQVSRISASLTNKSNDVALPLRSAVLVLKSSRLLHGHVEVLLGDHVQAQNGCGARQRDESTMQRRVALRRGMHDHMVVRCAR